MTILADLPTWRLALLLAAPALYLAAALAAGARATAPRCAGHAVRRCAGLALLAAAGTLAALGVDGAGVWRGPAWSLPGSELAIHASLRIDALGAVMLLLVAFIGWVIAGYSQVYLDGEAGRPRHLRQLMLTLAAVTLLVVTNSLLGVALAWVATSLALHGLLTFFGERPQALIAAHKKFLASRVADLCLLVAIGLIGRTLGTLEIDQAIAAARALPSWPTALHAAALLVVVAALIKCAQLPVHGWLIQVMEAPTPVSALLHAGVVNLGGFLLIRLGLLVAGAPAAQALLVVAGSVTAVIATLVTTTRVSIKVSLAWSTCAQMGFMLMQCGLGLHELALLHLVAHSLYKAHAFLGAGGAVEQHRLRQLGPAEPPMSAAAWLLGAIAGLAAVSAAAFAWGLHPSEAPALWAAAGILALALAPLIAGPLRHASGLWRLAGPGAALAVALAYFGLHAMASRWLGATLPDPAPALVAFVLGSFVLLFGVQAWVRIRPQGALARRLYPWLFNGLYLDELFTRATFRLWPARVPADPTHSTRATGAHA